MTAEKAFEHYYERAQRAAVAGWDFSFLDNRYLAEDLPWDYKQIVESYLKKAGSLLDIDTGGGEFIADLKPLPACTVATENYGPNVALAAQRLEPLGVKVVECDAESTLPFRDRTLVINRHGSLHVPEVLRVLQKNGMFITQQVGAQNFRSGLSMNKGGIFPEPAYSPWVITVIILTMRVIFIPYVWIRCWEERLSAFGPYLESEV